MKNASPELTDQAMALLNSIANRAEYLYHIVKSLDEAGVKDVDDILKKAIYNVGATWAEQSGEARDPHHFWDRRLTEEKRQILKLDWVRDEEDEIEFHFYRCPLVFGWQRMGLEPDMIARLCDIAHQVDYGNVETSGFKLDMDPGLGHGKERCTLIISKKQ